MPTLAGTADCSASGRAHQTIPWLEGRVARYLRGAVLDVKATGERDLAPVMPGATIIRGTARAAGTAHAAGAMAAYDAIFARDLLDAAEAPGSQVAALFALLRVGGHLVLQVRRIPRGDKPAAANPCTGPAISAALPDWSSAGSLERLIENALPAGLFQIVHCDPAAAQAGQSTPVSSRDSAAGDTTAAGGEACGEGDYGGEAGPARITLVVLKLRNEAAHPPDEVAARAAPMPSAGDRISFLFPAPQAPRAPQMTPDGPLLVRDYRPPPVRRILLLKLDHHGDFIIGLPAMRQLRAAFPGAHIRLVCGDWNRETACRYGIADEVRCFNFFPERSADWDGVPAADWSGFQRAAEGSFDLAIDLRVDEDTRYLLKHVDAAHRCGIGSAGRFPMLDIALPMGERDVIFPALLEGTNSLVNPDGTRQFGLACFESRMAVQNVAYHDTTLRDASGWLLRSERFRLMPGRFEARFELAPRRFLPARGGFGIKAAVLFGTCPGADPGSGGFVQAAETVIGRRALLLGRVRSVTLGFDVQTDGTTALLQVSAEGRALAGRLRFGGARLRRLNPDGARFRPSELHVGEKLSLLVNLIRERVLPAGEAAGILRAGAPSTGTTGTGGTAAHGGVAALREIVVAPFSNSEIRDWPAAHYAELIRKLAQTYGCRVRLVGSPVQRPMAEQLCGLEPIQACGAQVANDVGRSSWAELTAILRNADLVICNNSGIAHLAADEGCRTLAIYAASHQPGEWGPRGPRSRAIMMGIRCSPCGFERLEECPHDHVCMHALTPAMVMPHVEDLLGRPAVNAHGSGPG
jgi:ADP-heptose:LPS heptosyltransferase